jgi:hypothetical protein
LLAFITLSKVGIVANGLAANEAAWINAAETKQAITRLYRLGGPVIHQFSYWISGWDIGLPLEFLFAVAKMYGQTAIYSFCRANTIAKAFGP